VASDVHDTIGAEFGAQPDPQSKDVSPEKLKRVIASF